MGHCQRRAWCMNTVELVVLLVASRSILFFWMQSSAAAALHTPCGAPLCHHLLPWLPRCHNRACQSMGSHFILQPDALHFNPRTLRRMQHAD